MSRWPIIKLGDVLRLDLIKEVIDPSISYEMVGVLSFGKGLFKRETIESIFKRQTIPGFGFDVEVLYIAHKLGYKIKETPVDWFDSPATKVNFLKDSTKMFAELFKIRANDFNGLYK